MTTIFAAVIFCSSALAGAERPADVQKGINSLTESCKTVKELPGFEQRVDLNGDGVQDYILNFEHAECDGSSGYFCGSAGCQLQILLSHKGRFVLAYGLAMREFKLQKKVGRYRLRAIEHGTYCGRAGADECTTLYGFWGKNMRKVR